MFTSKSLEIKNFYSKNPFPGLYTMEDIQRYQGQNRYLSFISNYLHNKSSVLDAGCGSGFISNYFAYNNKNTKFTSVDFSDALDHSRKISQQLNLKNIIYHKEDLCNWKNKQKFDVVLCQGVLHHIPDYKTALENLKSFLKPNGIFLIGLYHPWSKWLQKILPKSYNNKVLEIDQEKNPFELSFTKTQVINMFQKYKFIKSYPSYYFNYKNGGLVIYIFRKENTYD